MLDIFKKSVKDAQFIKRETSASRHINIIGHFNDTTLIDKNGRLIKLFELEGIDYVTKSQLTLDVYKNQRNSLFKNFNSNFAIYAWTVREKSTDYLSGKFDQPFALTVNSKYKANITNCNLYRNKLVLALITKTPEGKVNQFAHMLKNLSFKLDSMAKEQYQTQIYEELLQVTQKLKSSFKDYKIKELSITKQDNSLPHSDALSFIARLVNLQTVNIPLLTINANSHLVQNRLFFNIKSGTIEVRTPNHSKKFAAMLSIKAYADNTYAGMLDGLSRLPIEMIITQSFRFFDTHATKSKVKDQQKDFEQIHDESISQTESLGDALDVAASGEAGFGLHYLSILCFADDQKTLSKNVAEITSEFSKLDIICIREDITCESTFWSQIPGNFSYIPPRDAPVSTKNFAGFLSLHNDAYGKPDNNHWGEALTVFETISSSQYFFNHHYKDIGNTLIFGAMGSGKTTLMGFLLTQSLKFGGKRVIFDKDRGLEILIRALGGNYEILKPGIKTGFNPCQLEDTPENKTFLNNLFKKMLNIHNQDFDEYDAEVINKVVNRLYTLPKQDRILKHIAPYFGAKSKGSLRARFEEWHSDGAKSWLFDNETDLLDLSLDILGFDLGAILNDQECKTPASMYLMHCVNLAMYGNRGAIYADEGWKLLNDDYFKCELEDQSRTPRKKNKFLCLATQSADDAAHTAINETLCTSAACKIFFPNPSAKESTYISKLGLSQREFELIKSLDTNEHYFLLNFGFGKESVVLRANLKNMEDEIAIISGRESTVKLLDEIRSQIGNNPLNWIPIFHERRKNL